MNKSTLRVAAAVVAVISIGITNSEAKTKNHKQSRLITDLLPANAATYTDVSARRKHRRHRHYSSRSRRSRAVDANGNRATGIVVSHKTGAKAIVAADNAPKFQAYIDDLETNHGATIYFMGGIRRGRCSSGSQHPCGKALDVCQLSWGKVDPRCKLPSRVILAAIALKNGLFEGGMWCSNDYGHAQITLSAEACGRTLYAAIDKFKQVFVSDAKAAELGEDDEAKVYDLKRPEMITIASQAPPPQRRVASRHRSSRHFAAKRHHRRYARVATQQHFAPVDRLALH